MHGFAGARFDSESELGGKTHHSQHTNWIFTEPCGGITHNTNSAFFNITQTIGKVVDTVVTWIVIHGIDGQIAATCIIGEATKYIVSRKHPAIGLLAMVFAAVVRFVFI